MKVVTLTGLKQVDELPNGGKCTPVEDAMMSGDKVIRCKEDIVELDKTAPEKVGEVVAMKPRRPRRRRTGQHLGMIDKPCVPEWVAVRTKLGKMVQRCHCQHGRFVKFSSCKRKD